MSDRLHYFETPGRRYAVAVPFELDARVGQWQELRDAMIRECPRPFTRDEWAYLIAFLDAANLRRPFVDSFGAPLPYTDEPVDVLVRPRGPVAVWLPNNVSLLGPLTLILLSLTGNSLRLKAGSQTEDLSEAFLHFAGRRLSAGGLSTGGLSTFLQERVHLERFDRHDPRGESMAAEASVRIVFGSDEAVSAVEALSHPVGSLSVAFSDRRSEAWIDADRCDDETLSTLIKVFAVYGQAGCTSPARVVLLDGAEQDAVGLRDRLIELWPRTVAREVPMHVASANVMARQWAAALGWDAASAPRNAAVLAAGTIDLPPIDALTLLPIVPATIEQAVARLPSNIQTIGHALSRGGDPRWLHVLASTPVKRFVPLAQMHHFGPLWDGRNFWRDMFEEVEVASATVAHPSGELQWQESASLLHS